MYKGISIVEGSFLKKISSTLLIMTLSILSFGQLTSTTTQTISSNQTYTGNSTIITGTVTISAGTTTFNGTLTIGTGGALIIQNGAKVIVNGTVSIGTSQTGSMTLQNGALLTVNPGATGSTAIAINSTSATALDVKTGGNVIVNRATPSTNTALGMNLDISSKATIAGSLQIRGGGLSMNGTSTLTYSGSNNDTIIGDPNATGAYFSNSTVLTVGSGVNLYIKGDTKNDSNAEFAINGNVSIIGKYQSGNNTAHVTGTGTVTTTGSLNADSYQGSVFGERYSCPTGPCAGNNSIKSSNTNTCNGGTVTITGTGISGATYQWFVSTTSTTTGFSNATGTSTSQNYSTIGSSTAQYTYYKRLYTLNGNTYSSNTLTITSNTNASGTITGDNEICVGSNTILYNYNASGGVWSSANTGIATINSSGTVTGVSVGSATINYTVVNNGCTAVATKSIIVKANVVSPIVTPATRCEAGTVNLSATGASGGATYQWYNQWGILNGQTNSTYTTDLISSNTSYYVTLKQGACESPKVTVVASVVSNGFTGPAITSNAPVCSGSTLSLSAATISSATYSWTGPSSFTSSSQNVSRTNATSAMAGTYKVKATIGSCVSTEISTTVVVNTGSATSVTATLTSPATTTICAGTSISLKATPTNGGSSPQYQWKKNGVNISTATNATYSTTTATNNDKYTVTLTNTALCPSTATSNEITITVNPAVAPSVAASASATSICPGTSITLTATPTNGGTTPTYVWKKGSTEIAGATAATYTTTAAANNDSYTVTMTSNAACASPASATSAAVVITINNNCVYTWTGATSTDWHTGSNWSSGLVPTSNNDVTIPASVTSGNMPIVSAGSALKSLNNLGAITIIGNGTGILNVSGHLINKGAFTSTAGSKIIVNMIGVTAQEITGILELHDLTINNNFGVTLKTSMTVNGTLSLPKGEFKTNDSLTINFDNGGNISYASTDKGSIVGKVSGRRDVVAKTHYIAAPFAGATSVQISQTTPLYVSPYWKMNAHAFSTQNWSAITTTTAEMHLGTGFTLSLPKAAPLILTGTYNHDFRLTGTVYSNASPSKFILVGNPYPSTIDWENVSGWNNVNVGGAIYFWDPIKLRNASYVAGIDGLPGVGTNDGTQYIPAMQSFFVATTGVGGNNSSVSINNNARTSAIQAYWRTANVDPQLIRLSVKSATGILDETIIRFDESSTDLFDSDVDAYKVMNSSIPSLYTKTSMSSTDYSINTLPMVGTSTRVPLNLKVPSDGVYELNCSKYSVLGYSMLLEDKLTNMISPIYESSVTVVAAKRTDSTNRFVLRFIENITTSTNASNTRNIQIATFDNSLVLSVDGVVATDVTIEVYAASGAKVQVLTNQTIESGVKIIPLNEILSSGVYIIKFNIGNDYYAGKVVIK